MPTARGEASEDRMVCGLLVKMKWLGVEFCGKGFDPLALDPNPRRSAESLTRRKVFQVSAAHHRDPIISASTVGNQAAIFHTALCSNGYRAHGNFLPIATARGRGKV